MNRERLILVLILVVAGGWLALRYVRTGQTTGLAYYEETAAGQKLSVSMAEAEHRLAAIEADPNLTTELKATQRCRIQFSLPRTIGIWVAALLTLAVFSFLYRDNPFYRIAEHIFVGVSAAYWMTVAFWAMIVPNLLGRLFPRLIKLTMLPGHNLDETGQGLAAPWWQLMDFTYLIPLVLGILLIWRLAPHGGWIARWPLAFIIGTTIGVRLIAYVEADFIAQINATMLPLLVPLYDPATAQLNWGASLYASLNNILIVLGVVCGLVYFFFSLEHRGLAGRAARMGIWVLMITFGAGFGYAVMGRIALLVGRFEFLFLDWLNVGTG